MNRYLKDIAGVALIAVAIALSVIALIQVFGFLGGLLAPKPMTNEQIIREVKRCKAADMGTYFYTSLFGLATLRVDCIPSPNSKDGEAS